ncbi:MAG: alpha-galactosidase [Lentisphaeria bacterium]|nr:alpha-galactosidase [Lentisphaeria bacterium]
MKRLFADDRIGFGPSGTFARLGDYFGGDQEDQLPFALHCAGVGRFGDPKISGRGNTRRFTFEDDKKSLRIVSTLCYDPGTETLRRQDSVTNLGRKPLTLRRYLARFPLARGEYEIHSSQSFWCREDQGAWTPLRAGKLELFSREGRWCESSVPFAVLRDLYAAHALGFMVFPEGDWIIRFSAVSKHGMLPNMTVEAGLSDDRLELPLAPGECWDAPAVVVQLLPGREAFSGAAAMGKLLNGIFPPRSGHAPVVYNTWLDRNSRLDVPRLRKQLAAAKECGCEVFVVDYGWYEDHRAFTRLDNWDECTDRAFFGKMREFACEVRRAGLGFGFWVEFEFFSTESKVVKAHPDWFFPSAHPNIVSPKIWLPEVEDMLVETLAEAIRRYDAVYIKNDMNHSQGYEPARLNLYMKGLARVMARLKKLLPRVTFENCSSGSLRGAAGSMLGSFDLHFISDNASPLENLRMIQQMGTRFPPGRIFHWYVGSELHPGEESSFYPGTVLQPEAATWHRARIEDLRTGLLSCITGMLGFSCDLASFSQENRRIIREFTDFFKAHREQILRSELHLLTPPENFEKKRGWLALQLSNPADDVHFVYVFHCVCDGGSCRVFHPEALAPEKMYRTREVLAPSRSASVSRSGAELVRDGIPAAFGYDQQEGFRGKLFLIEPENKGKETKDK